VRVSGGEGTDVVYGPLGDLEQAVQVGLQRIDGRLPLLRVAPAPA